jgi:saccharopine dehydrogenase-like NADP-dependent oxidoreductase
MSKILILGANGQIARVATQLFLERTDAQLTLYLRKSDRLRLAHPDSRIRVIEGGVLDADTLETAMDPSLCVVKISCQSPMLGLVSWIHENHRNVDAEILLGRRPGVSGCQGANIGLVPSYLAC